MEPIATLIRSERHELALLQWSGDKEVEFLLCACIVGGSLIIDLTALDAFLPGAKPDCHTNTNLVLKYVPTFTPSAIACGSSVALQVNDVNLIEFFCHHLPEPVKGARVNE